MRRRYRLPRIVYVDDVPVYVDDDRRARPLPERERSRFSYQGVVRSRDGGRNERERGRGMPPVDGQGPEREGMPSQGRERERVAPPASSPQSMSKPVSAPAAVRDGRGAPQGRAMDQQPADRGAGRGRLPQQDSSKANKRQRAGGADQKHDRKASGRDKGRGQDERERRGGTGDQSGD